MDLSRELIQAAKIFWDDFLLGLSEFWNQTYGAYSDMASRILRFDIPSPGGYYGLVRLAFDTLDKIWNAVSSLFLRLSAGPFLAVLQVAVTNFEYPKDMGHTVVTTANGWRIVMLAIADECRRICLNPTSTTLAIMQFSFNAQGVVDKIADTFAKRWGKVLVSKLKGFLRNFGFLILQVIVALISIGGAFVLAMSILALQDKAKTNPKFLRIYDLRQDKPRIRQKGSYRTRKPE